MSHALAAQRGFVFVGCQAQADTDRDRRAVEPAVGREQGPQPRPFAGEIGHQAAEAVFLDRRGDDRERARQPSAARIVLVARFVGAARGEQQILARLQHQFGGAALLHHVEVRRDAGFERKAAQQRLAEGMDGLDLHAARHVEHRAEQPARAPALGGARLLADQGAQFGGELALIQRRPHAEPLVDADRHLGGRRLGERQAENADRRRAMHQQAEHAVGQHRGLAGAGRGRHPHGRIGLHRGIAALLVVGALDHVAHSPPPSPSWPFAPPADHSLTRARWP